MTQTRRVGAKIKRALKPSSILKFDTAWAKTPPLVRAAVAAAMAENAERYLVDGLRRESFYIRSAMDRRADVASSFQGASAALRDLFVALAVEADDAHVEALQRSGASDTIYKRRKPGS